jgi:hypothetical protein
MVIHRDLKALRPGLADAPPMANVAEYRGERVNSHRRASCVWVTTPTGPDRVPLRLKEFARWFEGRALNEPPPAYSPALGRRIAS